MSFVAGVLQDKLSQLKSRRKVYLALSGGLDSTVLFHLLVELGVEFSAIHVNHQLSANSERWQLFCADLARKHNVAFQSVSVDVISAGEGVEAAARERRYDVFENIIQSGETLLAAHHADDQVETLIFRLIRGAGVRGLSSMAEERALGAGTLLRPMLSISQQQIEQYASENNLQWVEDESNNSLQFDRNYLRKHLLPKLYERWPIARENILKVRALAAKESALLQEYALIDYEYCLPGTERLGESLSIQKLQVLSEARRHNVLRFWMQKHQYGSIGETALSEIQSLMEARDDATPRFTSSEWAFYRYRGRIHLLPARKPNSVEPVLWDAQNPIDFENGARLCLLEGAATIFEIRFRQGGERCQPESRKHSQTLKKLLQEYSLEPWWRDSVPLIYLNGELCAVGDLFRCSAGKSFKFKWYFPE